MRTLFPTRRRRLVYAASRASISILRERERVSERGRERERRKKRERERECSTGSFNWSTIEPVISLMTVMIAPAGATPPALSLYILAARYFHYHERAHTQMWAAAAAATSKRTPEWWRARPYTRPSAFIPRSFAYFERTVNNGRSTGAERPRPVNRLAWLALLI